nr:MAG TPA: hypothetical protein [Caudoviricetes sp.]
MKRLTLNIPAKLNEKFSGKVNFSKAVNVALRRELKKYERIGCNGDLVKKNLVIDEDILDKAKELKINLSQVLVKFLLELDDAQEELNKVKK